MAGVVLYARNLTAERRRVEARDQRLILEDARSLMRSDPTAAYDRLQTYRGDQSVVRAQLEAEAIGRGVAVLRLPTEELASVKAFPIPGGFFVAGMGNEFAKVFVNGTTRRLRNKPTARSNIYYSYAHNLAIYICADGDLCVYDVHREQQLEPRSDATIHDVVDISLSPDGDAISVITRSGVASVRRLSKLAQPAQWQSAPSDVKSSYFVGHDTLLLSADTRLDIVSLTGEVPRVSSVSMAPVWSASQSSRLGLLAVGTTEGEIVVVDPRGPIVARRLKVCDAVQVFRAHFLSNDSLIAYACSGGQKSGIWRYATDEHIELVNGTSVAAISLDRRYFCIGSYRGQIVVYDAQARAIAARFVTSAATYVLTPPTAVFSYLVSRDINGNLRAWRMPEQPVIDRVQSTPAYGRLVPLRDGSTIFFENGSHRRYFRDGRMSRLQVSASARRFMRLLYTWSLTSSHVAAYGDTEIDMWAIDRAVERYKPIGVGHRELSSVVFTRDDSALIVARNDAVVERWSIDGSSHMELFRLPWTLRAWATCQEPRMILLGTDPGFLWLIVDNELRFAGSLFAELDYVRCSPGGERVAITDAMGRVSVLDTRTMHWSRIAELDARASWLAISPDGRELSVVARDAVRTYRLPTTSDDSVSSTTSLTIAPPQAVAYSPDNRWLAVMADQGTLSFYRRADAHWVVVPLGELAIASGVFSEDSTRFFAKDASGMVYVIDMTAPMFGEQAASASSSAD